MSTELFEGLKDYQHGSQAKVGVLVLNLGTPDEPTEKALRPYLREFLSDPRVIELNRVLWWLILQNQVCGSCKIHSAVVRSG